MVSKYFGLHLNLFVSSCRQTANNTLATRTKLIVTSPLISLDDNRSDVKEATLDE